MQLIEYNLQNNLAKEKFAFENELKIETFLIKEKWDSRF